MVVTPSFTHLSIHFSNQEVCQLQPCQGCWICEARVDQFLWKQGLQDEYSVLLSPVLQYCDFSKQSFSVYDNLFLSLLIIDHCFSLLMLSSHDSFLSANITLETVTLDTLNNVAVFVSDAPANHAPTICTLSEFFHVDRHLTRSLMP
jgi:hypothetical protein